MSVSFVTNAGNLGARKRILAGKTEESFRIAAKLQLVHMKSVAETLSSGPLSTKSLRWLGHPYSKRLGPNSALLPDYVINAQSGEFRASWVCRAQKTQIGWTITLYNTSAHAKFMMGTQRMRFRPILDEIIRRTEAQLPLEVKKAVHAAVVESGGTAPVAGGAFVGLAGGGGSGGSGGSVWGGLVYAVAAGVSTVAGGVESAL
jgi:hypothetical protein